MIFLCERRIIGKIRKTYFSGEVIFEGQNPKKWQKILKFLIVPKQSLGQSGHLYTYERQIEHVGFT